MNVPVIILSHVYLSANIYFKIDSVIISISLFLNKLEGIFALCICERETN